MTARKKILISAFVLLTSLVAIVFSLKNRKTALPQKIDTELKFVSSTQAATVGEPFKFSLFFKNKNTDVVSFDAVVGYDSTLVRIDDIQTTNIFPVITRKLIEDFKNRFILSGVQTNLKSKLVVSEGELAEITATPLKTGEADFQFIIDGNKYTNLVRGDLKNIVFTTNVLKIKIQE